MSLSAASEDALRLLAGYEKESVNAYGLSALCRSNYSGLQADLRVLKQLERQGFVAMLNPDGHRAWGPECDHYGIDFVKTREWVADDAAVRDLMQQFELAPVVKPLGPRSRQSAIAS
jgi:hypothetical protein